MPHDLDIGVIYTYERDMMSRLVETIPDSGRGLNMRLILVDNASNDGVEPWARVLNATHVVRNERRLSYAENLNRILDASTARYVLLMNTDMYFEPEGQCLRRMVDFMDRHPDCGLSGCRLLHADGTDALAARRFQTLRLILARRCGLGRWMRGTLNDHFYSDHSSDETWACDWLSGCFLMVRREAFLEVGHVDESFGKYFEDVDYCLRMAQSGWRVMYHGAAFCYHLEQRSSKKLLSLDACRHLRAYLRWLGKWGLRPSDATIFRETRRVAA